MFNVLNVLLIAVISALMFFIAQPLNKKLKIAPPIFFLVMGILFGLGGLALIWDKLYIFGNPDIFPSWKIYSTGALYLLFFGSGFSIQINKLKANGKSVWKLMTIPVYFELLIMWVIGFFILNLITDLTFVETGIIATLFAMASPANVIPLTTAHLKAGRPGDKQIGSSLIAASILDNVTPLPLFILLLPILENGQFSIVSLVSALIGFVALAAISIGLGKVIQLAFTPLTKKIENNQLSPMYYAIGSFIILLIAIVIISQVPAGKSAINLFGFVVAMFTGSAIANFSKSKAVDSIGFASSKIFNIIGLPIIFLGVGASLNLKQIFDLKIILLSIIFVIIAVALKLMITNFILKRDDYNIGARRYAMSAFLPKGVTLINLSILIAGIAPAGSNIVVAMTTIAAFGIILTIPLGITLMVNRGKEWLAVK